MGSEALVVAVPEFHPSGDLPPGVYRASLAEVAARFGQGSAWRRTLAERLGRVYQLAHSTGHLAHFILFGSFVTAKALPRDVDVFLLMDDAFDVSTVTGEAAVLFAHPEAEPHAKAGVFWPRHRERTRTFSPFAHVHFGANVLWRRRSGSLAEETALMELWQQDHRVGIRRGIIEIVSDAVTPAE